MKESTTANKAFTTLNMLVLLFVTVSGFIKGDLSNWKLREDDVPQAAAHETGYEGLCSPRAAFREGWDGQVIPLMLYSWKSHFLPFLPALLAKHQTGKVLSPDGLMLEE